MFAFWSKLGSTAAERRSLIDTPVAAKRHVSEPVVIGEAFRMGAITPVYNGLSEAGRRALFEQLQIANPELYRLLQQRMQNDRGFAAQKHDKLAAVIQQLDSILNPGGARLIRDEGIEKTLTELISQFNLLNDGQFSRFNDWLSEHHEQLTKLLHDRYVIEEAIAQNLFKGGKMSFLNCVAMVSPAAETPVV
jgi:hypothetical protein